MNLFHYLFSFEGRINRAKQWAILLVGLAFWVLFCVLFSVTIGLAAIGELLDGTKTVAQIRAEPQANAFLIGIAAINLLGLYIGLAVMTKRLHDRDKSAWWLLVFFLLPNLLNIPALMALPAQLEHMGEIFKAVQQNLPPPPPPVEPLLVTIPRGIASLIWLWMFVELYIFSGTPGDNRYGPNPLAGRS